MVFDAMARRQDLGLHAFSPKGAQGLVEGLHPSMLQTCVNIP